MPKTIPVLTKKRKRQESDTSVDSLSSFDFNEEGSDSDDVTNYGRQKKKKEEMRGLSLRQENINRLPLELRGRFDTNELSYIIGELRAIKPEEIPLDKEIVDKILQTPGLELVTNFMVAKGKPVVRKDLQARPL